MSYLIEMNFALRNHFIVQSIYMLVPLFATFEVHTVLRISINAYHPRKVPMRIVP